MQTLISRWLTTMPVWFRNIFYICGVAAMICGALLISDIEFSPATTRLLKIVSVAGATAATVAKTAKVSPEEIKERTKNTNT